MERVNGWTVRGVDLIRIGALALVLGLAVLLAPGQARANPADHTHHADHAQPMDHESPPADTDRSDGGLHHGGTCHCISAACTAALPVGSIDLTVAVALYQPVAVPVTVPPPQRIADPPAKPPRT